MIIDLPIVLIALICISPSLLIMLLLYVVFVESDLRRQGVEAEKRKDQ